MHLLTACKSAAAARAVMKDILRLGEGKELLYAQAEGGDYSRPQRTHLARRPLATDRGLVVECPQI